MKTVIEMVGLPGIGKSTALRTIKSEWINENITILDTVDFYNLYADLGKLKRVGHAIEYWIKDIPSLLLILKYYYQINSRDKDTLKRLRSLLLYIPMHSYALTRIKNDYCVIDQGIIQFFWSFYFNNLPMCDNKYATKLYEKFLKKYNTKIVMYKGDYEKSAKYMTQRRERSRLDSKSEKEIMNFYITHQDDEKYIKKWCGGTIESCDNYSTLLEIINSMINMKSTHEIYDEN